MSIIINSNTKILVQGITGREGNIHSESMKSYGSNIVAGVTPGKGGSSVSGIPVYNTVSRAMLSHPEINTSVIFVPASFASSAVYEAIDGGIKTVVVITERIPVHDSIKFIEYAKLKGVNVIGPNCPGLISPGECKVGIMPGHLFKPGTIGMVSRSGTLTYEIADSITRSGLGQSSAIGIGGDPVIGLGFKEIVEMFRDDDKTEAIVVIGEIGGDSEERLSSTLSSLGKPVIGFISGHAAPPGKRMGQAGAIITMGMGTASGKKDAFRKAGVTVAELPSQIPDLLKNSLMNK